MLTLLFYLLLHCLFWGAVGAVLASRAHLSRWVGATLSIVLPILGAIGLLIASRRHDGSARNPAPKSWRRWGWIGVVGGSAIAAAALLSWPDAKVGASAQERELVDLGLHLADIEQLGLVAIVIGLAIAGCSYVVVRTGRRGWAISAAALAWLPAFFSGLLILSEGFIDDLGERMEHAANAVEVAQVAQAQVDSEYSIGAGPYVCLIGGMAVMFWVAYMSFRAPVTTETSSHTDSQARASVGEPSGGWSDSRGQEDSISWADWSSKPSNGASVDRTEWDW